MNRTEAIKILRETHDKALFSVRTALETLIPELKESEDERIRKGLIHHLKELREWKVGSMSPIKVKEHYDAWIAYLEKQKPLSTEETELNSIAFLEQMGYTCIPPGKEQQPAGWSEEDKAKITFLERLIRYNVPDGQYGWADGHKGGFVTKLEAISMLKSLRPSWKPSEEQMLNLKKAYESYDFCDGERKALESLYEQLKTL